MPWRDEVMSEILMAGPPALSPERFEQHEGLRETTLAVFTEPRINAALRVVGDELYTMGLEYQRHWPREPEGAFRHLARAGLADLRHLQGFFASLGREREATELTPPEIRVSRLCGRLSVRVQEIANVLEQELDRGAGEE
jgi:hypothetical protein